MKTHKVIYHFDTDVNNLSDILPQLILLLLFCSLFILYISAIIYTNRRYKRWPLHRTICFGLGILFALIAVVAPLASHAPMDFSVHMISHLLLGMLSPLLMVIAAPMTLLLRTVSIPLARILSSMLKSSPSRIITHPLVTTFLNLGGLWLLYTSNLYELMHENLVIYLVVHFHLFMAGYLFTISIISFDPMFHNKSFQYRAIVLIIALAGHGIISKYIFAHPPIGVPIEQAEVGSMLMYYGGDAIDAILIFLFCLQWYRVTRPRVMEIMGSREKT